MVMDENFKENQARVRAKPLEYFKLDTVSMIVFHLKSKIVS
ncbi:hypothetical protein MNBD_BACTEROID03-1514 [hydrothermal vent metagenome]|uniref:Uncharacterized protein n=1 Tax=hydrothermal vent metagenome TaxID=652676 RepID=A0A3B0TJT7_9ZZZZ